MSPPRPAAVVILAAGEGTRMKSATPKVLHTLCGRSMLGHVVAAAQALQPEHLVVVVGAGREQVTAHLAEIAPEARAVVQEQQNGTGHAVRVALEALPDLEGAVLVAPGDAPLLTAELFTSLLEQHAGHSAAATLLTARLPDPTGYGRVLRDAGGVTAVVEQKDATPAQLAVDEINTSVYAFDARPLGDALGRLTTDNAQGEEYLTDVIGLLVGDGRAVTAVEAPDWRETAGVNDRVQLAAARATFRDRLLLRWMRDGVTITDPQTTWLGVDVVLEPDATIHQNTQLHGSTVVEAGATVGPNCTLTDTRVGRGATVVNATCDGAEVGELATVGPYTYLRPGTRLGRKAKAGGFVEIKASDVGDDAKVPHLSYVGDATIGARSNIGAATVFVNYDGERKHRTTVGEDARVGSDTMLVAPVEIGDGAYTAAGSVITEDVPPRALAVGRARQRNVEGWVDRKRGAAAGAGSPDGHGEQKDAPA